MAFDELFPSARSTPGKNVVAVAFQYVLHRVASDRLDNELLQLAKNPRMCEGQLVSVLENGHNAVLLRHLKVICVVKHRKGNADGGPKGRRVEVP